MVQQHFILAFLWILFCVLHSLLASVSIKQKLATAMRSRFKHYRLLYTLFAFATLGVVIYYQINMNSPLIFNPSTLSYIIGIAVALAGLVIMAVCIKKYFLSLSGLKSLFQESPANSLMLNGIHRFVRHPLYAGTFMAIWGALIVLPLLSILIANFIITMYTLIGITLEEKKLEAEFGDAYKIYKQKVPKLFPALRSK